MLNYKKNINRQFYAVFYYIIFTVGREPTGNISN
jgi:hypothetical protein